MLTLDYLIFVFVGKLNGFNKRGKKGITKQNIGRRD